MTGDALPETEIAATIRWFTAAGVDPKGPFTIAKCPPKEVPKRIRLSVV